MTTKASITSRFLTIDKLNLAELLFLFACVFISLVLNRNQQLFYVVLPFVLATVWVLFYTKSFLYLLVTFYALSSRFFSHMLFSVPAPFVPQLHNIMGIINGLVLILEVLYLVYILCRIGPVHFLETPLLKHFLIYVLFMVILIPFTKDKFYAFRSILYFANPLLISALVFHSMSTKREITCFFNYLVFLIILSFPFSIYQIADQGWNTRIVGTWSDWNSYAKALLYLLSYVLLLASSKARYFLLSLALMAMIFLTQTRIVWIMMVALLVLYYLNHRIAKRDGLILCLIVISFLLFSPIAHQRIGSWGEWFEAYESGDAIYANVYGRQEIWKVTLSNLLSFRTFFVGNGTGSTDSWLRKNAEREGIAAGMHNRFLYVLLDTGFIGLGLCLSIFVSPMWWLWKNRERISSDFGAERMAIGVFGSIVVYLISWISENYPIPSNTYFFVVLGLMLRYVHTSIKEEATIA